MGPAFAALWRGKRSTRPERTGKLGVDRGVLTPDTAAVLRLYKNEG
jgi:hypothetical protein